MELRNAPGASNGPERRTTPGRSDARTGSDEIQKRLAETQKVTTTELSEIREHIDRVKSEAADRALRMPPAGADKLDLSNAASSLFAQPERESASLVAELKAAYESGTINTRSRIERAAHRLLGGE